MALADRFVAEERDARLLASGWLRHPLVRDAVQRTRAMAESIIAPLRRHLTDQVAVTLFAHRVLDVAACFADGTESANPFETWQLTDAEEQSAPKVIVQFGIFIATLAKYLATEGVGLDPSSPGDQLVLAQLLLLDIDWSLDPLDLAEELNVGAPSMITRDGRGLEHRDGRGRRGRHNAEAIRAELRADHPDYRALSSVPYAGRSPGGRRNPRRDTEIRRRAMSEVAQAFPTVTAGRISATYRNGGVETSGGLLRELLEDTAGTECPSASTLGRDLKIVRSVKST